MKEKVVDPIIGVVLVLIPIALFVGIVYLIAAML